VSVYLPCATAEETWAFVRAMHGNVRAIEVACEERIDGVGDLWAVRPRLDKLTVVSAAGGKFDGPSCELRRDAE